MTNLGIETIGDGTRRLVFLHGFTQTRSAWRDVANHLLESVPDLCCVLVDLPGHGESAAVTADPEQAARLVTEAGGEAAYVGYSLGGRIALRAAVDHPRLVRGTIVVSATAGIEDESEREQRARSDDALADRIELIGVDAFLTEWLAQPLFQDLQPAVARREDRSTNTASGLADSLRRCGQGRQLPLWRAVADLRCPLLAIAGSRDAKYVALARRLAATAPRGSLRLIDGAGHSVPLERPAELAAEIAYWMASPTE